MSLIEAANTRIGNSTSAQNYRRSCDVNILGVLPNLPMISPDPVKLSVLAYSDQLGPTYSSNNVNGNMVD